MPGYFSMNLGNSYQVFEVLIFWFYCIGIRINVKGFFFRSQFFHNFITPVALFHDVLLQIWYPIDKVVFSNE